MANENRVADAIEVFLKRKGQNSINTRRTYEKAIKAFFQDMRGKELDELTVEDLVFGNQEIEEYQVGLKEKFKSSTVNTRMFALKSCYEKLRGYGFEVEPSWFDLEKYEEVDKEGSDPMTHAEVVKAISRVLAKRR